VLSASQELYSIAPSQGDPQAVAKIYLLENQPPAPVDQVIHCIP